MKQFPKRRLPVLKSRRLLLKSPQRVSLAQQSARTASLVKMAPSALLRPRLQSLQPISPRAKPTKSACKVLQRGARLRTGLLLSKTSPVNYSVLKDEASRDPLEPSGSSLSPRNPHRRDCPRGNSSKGNRFPFQRTTVPAVSVFFNLR